MAPIETSIEASNVSHLPHSVPWLSGLDVENDVLVLMQILNAVAILAFVQDCATLAGTDQQIPINPSDQLGLSEEDSNFRESADVGAARSWMTVRTAQAGHFRCQASTSAIQVRRNRIDLDGGVVVG